MRTILLGLIMSCVFTSVTAQQYNTKKTLEGNGKLETRNIPVKSFNSLKASGIYELKISQGNTESVKIEADENLQSLFKVSNDGTKLVIDMEKLEDTRLDIKNKMIVYVTFRTLQNMELSTIGNIKAEEALSFENLDLSNKSIGNVDLKINAQKISVENKSVGNLTLTGKAQTAVMTNNSVGNLYAGNFLVQTLDINNSGIGNAEVNAEKELKVKDSFMGKVKNKGAARTSKKGVVI
jgi:hypothetical protein